MAEYTWKQTIFTPKDLDGAGQYIVRESKSKLQSPHFTDTGYLSTVMYKVGYLHQNKEENFKSNQYLLISVADGWSIPGYFVTIDSEGNKIEDSSEWTFVSFSGETNTEAKQKICDFLNNNQYGETYRFATREELIRVAYGHNWRTRG